MGLPAKPVGVISHYTHMHMDTSLMTKRPTRRYHTNQGLESKVTLPPSPPPPLLLKSARLIMGDVLRLWPCIRPRPRQPYSCRCLKAGSLKQILTPNQLGCRTCSSASFFGTELAIIIAYPARLVLAVDQPAGCYTRTESVGHELIANDSQFGRLGKHAHHARLAVRGGVCLLL